MGDTLSLVTICLDQECSSQLKHFIDSTSLIQLRAELTQYLEGENDTSLADQLKDLRPDICLIDFDPSREQATRTAERVHEDFAETAIFATSANSQPELIIKAMRCGCSEYLVKPLDLDQLVEIQRFDEIFAAAAAHSLDNEFGLGVGRSGKNGGLGKVLMNSLCGSGRLLTTGIEVDQTDVRLQILQLISQAGVVFLLQVLRQLGAQLDQRRRVNEVLELT